MNEATGCGTQSLMQYTHQMFYKFHKTLKCMLLIVYSTLRRQMILPVYFAANSIGIILLVIKIRIIHNVRILVQIFTAEFSIVFIADLQFIF